MKRIGLGGFGKHKGKKGWCYAGPKGEGYGDTKEIAFQAYQRLPPLHIQNKVKE